MTRRSARKPPVPLDSASLEELALFYVGRYATTQAKLRGYLQRKLAQRGWSEEREPPVAEIAQRFAERGYVDDAAVARAKATSLAARGYGPRRLDQAVYAAGIDENDAREARDILRDSAWDSAVIFARKRRIGPFSAQNLSRAEKDKAFAAMMRAGHSFEISRIFINSPPGDMPERPD